MATAAATPIPLNAHVQVAAGTGRVRFVGQTAFAAGKWIGIELDEQGTGKNDGTVQVRPSITMLSKWCLLGALSFMADAAPCFRMYRPDGTEHALMDG